MSARLPITFRIFRGDQLVREETLTQGAIKLGKVASAHLRLDDDSVSRMHAIIEVDLSGSVQVIDLGSTRGTFVNGQRINKAKLETGDTLGVGALRIEVAFGAPAVQTPAVPMPAVPMSAVPMSAVPISVVPAPAVRASAVPMPAVQAPAMLPFTSAPADDEIGAKAIEVAAMLGDSVVGVKHCIDPKSGKVSPKTWGMFAAGAACLIASTVAFASSVSTAASNKGGLDYWTHVAHRPAYSFRPEIQSVGYDWVAFGGLALGLAATIAALARLRNEKRTPYYRIGTAPGVELPLEGAPTASFPLVAPAATGDDFVFNYGAGIDGELTVGGKTTPFAELAASGRARPSATTAGAFELPIPANARIRARAGQTTFMVSAVPQPRRHAAPFLAGLEGRTVKYFAGSLVAHIAFVALAAQVPYEDSATNIDLASREPVAINSSSSVVEEVPPPVDQDQGTGGQTDGQAKPMALDPGEAGKPDVARVDGHMAVKNNQLDPQLARKEAIEEARKTGILGDMQVLNGAISAATANGDISSGFDDVSMYGALYGADAGESHGYFGMARSGFGRGGGCTQEPCGLIGTDPHGYNTIGTGKHAGAGWGGPGGNGPGMHRHEPGVPKPIIGEAKGVGDLDKSIIRRYIKRNIDKIGYCYEHQLLAHPTIEGEILVSFFISPTGSVTASAGTGFDSTVARCVADVIGGIEFPKPAGGGGVNVNYPFTFHTAR